MDWKGFVDHFEPATCVISVEKKPEGGPGTIRIVSGNQKYIDALALAAGGVELDSDNWILGYSIDFEPTGLSDAGRVLLLGEVKASDEYSITDAAAPDVGFGYIRVMRNKGTVTYEGWWYYKLKFALGSEETRTKEQNIEWRTPTLNGVGAGVQIAADGPLHFAVHESFESLSAAKTWLKRPPKRRSA